MGRLGGGEGLREGGRVREGRMGEEIDSIFPSLSSLPPDHLSFLSPLYPPSLPLSLYLSFLILFFRFLFLRKREGGGKIEWVCSALLCSARLDST